MGLLGDIFSASDRLKRNVKGLLDDPASYLEMIGGLLTDDRRTHTARTDRLLKGTATDKDYSDSVAFALNSIAPLGMTAWHGGPRAEAMRIAQKNAAKPIEEGGLGLRPDNTPMERAKAMGFGNEVYHGTPQVIDGKEMKLGQSEPAFAFTSDRIIANQYARTARQRGEYSPNVVPATLNLRNPYITDFNGREKTRGFDDLINIAKTNGNDGLVVKNVIDDPQGLNSQSWPQDVYMAFEPNQIRSRFAAFDPARRHEADLLGFADPRLLALIAAGTGGGLLAAQD